MPARGDGGGVVDWKTLLTIACSIASPFCLALMSWMWMSAKDADASQMRNMNAITDQVNHNTSDILVIQTHLKYIREGIDEIKDVLEVRPRARQSI